MAKKMDFSAVLRVEKGRSAGARSTSTAHLVSNSVRAQAIEFPGKVDAFLAERPHDRRLKDAIAQGKALATLLAEIDVGREFLNPVAFGVLKLKAEAGKRMPRGKGGRGTKTPTGAVGVSNPNVISAYRKIADHQGRLSRYWNDCHEKNEITQTGFIRWCDGAHVSNNSGETEWYTPQVYIEAARTVLGGIDLDPASSKKAQKLVAAAKYYTAKDDGLSKKWAGRVWMNPPYPAGLVDEFISKLLEHLQSGEVTQAITLTNNATDSKWFQSVASASIAACFPAGRIKYLDEALEPANSPLQGQVFLYFGNSDEFVDVFSEFGSCWRSCG